MVRPRVDAVVLNHNGRDLLEVILPSLRAQTYPQLEVMVVDDGSTDDSLAYLSDRWPDVRVVATGTTVGVAAAMNRGLSATRGEYIALLNNDLELDPRWVEQLVDTLERFADAASASGKQLNFHDREVLDGAGDFLHWRGLAGRRGYGEPDRGQYDVPEPVFSACGGAALYRRSAFDVVGPFDEDFYAYHEDVDWGFRAQLAGFTSRYVPAAVAYHIGGATTERADGARFALMRRRNPLLFVVKDYPLPNLIRRAPSVLALQLYWLVEAAADGSLARTIRSWPESARLLYRMARKRRSVRRTVRVDRAHLDSVVSAGPPLLSVRDVVRVIRPSAP